LAINFSLLEVSDHLPTGATRDTLVATVEVVSWPAFRCTAWSKMSGTIWPLTAAECWWLGVFKSRYYYRQTFSPTGL